MTSTRTKYREKRVDLVKECINLLINMLSLEKKELEKIPLPFFKNIKKSLERKEHNY